MSWKAAIQSIYPDALPGSEVTEKYVKLLEEKHHADRATTLLTTSVCPDEINRATTDFPAEFAGSGPFFLGGLAGVPFTGLTGLTAFAHHIPDGGTAFIFYGPHIGVSDDGEWGKISRVGQAKLGGSCGALMLALGRLQQDEDYVPVGKDIDHQQMTLERALMPFKAQILSADNPVLEITEVAYKHIHGSIKELVEAVKGEFHCARIALLGGVLINTSPDKDDYVEVRDFEVIELAH